MKLRGISDQGIKRLAKVVKAQESGGGLIDSDYRGEGPVVFVVVYSPESPGEPKFGYITGGSVDHAIERAHDAWTDFRTQQDYSDIEEEIRIENPDASDIEIAEKLYNAVTEDWEYEGWNFSSGEDLLSESKQNDELKHFLKGMQPSLDYLLGDADYDYKESSRFKKDWR